MNNSDGQVVIDTSLNTKSFEKQIQEVEQELNELEKSFETQKKQKPYEGQEEDLKELSIQIEKTKNKLVDLNSKQAKLDLSSYNEAGIKLSNIGNQLENVAKKTIKWGLAVFSVRSAYSGIRKIVSTVLSQNDELNAKMEAIKGTLANAFAPLVELIINLVLKLLGVLNVVWKKLSGKDLFVNTTTGAKKTNAEIKKMNKQLASFDEMNILSDTSHVSMPKIDIAGETAKIEQFIANLTEKWRNLGKEMEEALNNPKAFNKAYGFWGTFMYGVTKLFYGFYETINGISNFIVGIMMMLIGVFTGNTDLIKQGWDLMIEGLKNTAKGLFDFIVGILTSGVGLAIGIVGEVKSAIVAIGLAIWNFITGLFAKIKNYSINIGTAIGSVIGTALKMTINGIIELIEGLLNTPIKAINGLLNVINAVPGVNIPEIATFNLPKLKLAKGGILSNPGKGVPVGYNAIAGEAGREGYIPLDDERALSMIGQSIGRFVTINANITNTMNGRVISRELQKVQNDSDFSFNR